MYVQEPLADLLEDLSARKPVPGGGSACAAAASLGCALGVMVANFTIGKASGGMTDSEVRDLLARLATLRDRFAVLIDEDAAAYDAVRRARKAKAPPEEVEKALVGAMEAPLRACRASDEALVTLSALARGANPLLASDLASAALLLEAAFHGFTFNVLANLADIKDGKTVSAAREEVRGLARSVEGLKRALLEPLAGGMPA